MEWLLGISSTNAEVGTQEGTTSSTSTGTDSEAEEAKKKRQKVERQRERRAEQKAAQLAGTEWVSQRQPSSPKAVRNKQRRQEQAAATDCGLQWVSKKKDAMPPPQLQNVDTPAGQTSTGSHCDSFGQWARAIGMRRSRGISNLPLESQALNQRQSTGFWTSTTRTSMTAS